MTSPGAVGPILAAGQAADAVIAALREENRDLETVDRGSYVRVVGHGEVSVSRAAIERHLGAPFRFPADLERIMPSFQGKLTLDEERARWSAARGAS